MEKQSLTTRQQEILDYLESFTDEFGYPPTVREICAATGLKSPRSASQHLQSLENKGYIQRGRDKSRAIRFLHRKAGAACSDAVQGLPLRGSAYAGQPGAAGDCHEDTFYVDKQLVCGEKSFLMRVQGASMIDAHIVEGDMIVVSPETKATSGDIVVAEIGDETTVKRCEIRGSRKFLTSANARMEPIEITDAGDRINIVGKVVGLIRQMN